MRIVNESKKHLDHLFYDPKWKPPELIYGENLLPEFIAGEEKYAVSTMEIPWNLVKDKVSTPPAKIVFVESMELPVIEKLERKIPPVKLVLGIGGGSAHDFAKYVAFKKQCCIYQVPTIISGDASITSAIGIRDKGKVKYIAHVFIDKVLVDYALLSQAPRELITYGAADVLSSHTALYDWKLASDKGQEKFNERIYRQAKEEFLSELKKKRFEIKRASKVCIKTIMGLYLRYAKVANSIGTDRAQEGSEHFFAYNAEYVTGRHFTHGKLLAVGIFVSSYLQNNEFDETVKLMNDMGMQCQLKSIGLREEEFTKIMETMNEFVIDGGYYYSIFNDVKIRPSCIQELLKLLT